MAGKRDAMIMECAADCLNAHPSSPRHFLPAAAAMQLLTLWQRTGAEICKYICVNLPGAVDLTQSRITCYLPNQKQPTNHEPWPTDARQISLVLQFLTGNT